MAVLGAVCTGLAFAAFATLVGRVGATRGSVTVYLVPVVAIVLGVAVNGEPVQPVSLAGIALVLAGAYLTSCPNQSPSQTGREQAAGSPPAAADPARRPAPRPEDSPPQRCRCRPGDQTEPASSGSPQIISGASDCTDLPRAPGAGLLQAGRLPGAFFASVAGRACRSRSFTDDTCPRMAVPLDDVGRALQQHDQVVGLVAIGEQHITSSHVALAAVPAQHPKLGRIQDRRTPRKPDQAIVAAVGTLRRSSTSSASQARCVGAHRNL